MSRVVRRNWKSWIKVTENVRADAIAAMIHSRCGEQLHKAIGLTWHAFLDTLAVGNRSSRHLNAVGESLKTMSFPPCAANAVRSGFDASTAKSRVLCITSTSLAQLKLLQSQLTPIPTEMERGRAAPRSA